MRHRNALLTLLLIGIVALTILPPLIHAPPAYAATGLTGAINAEAYTGGVTKGRFVSLQAAGVIQASTAVTDKICGVCELTATAGGFTRYAPVGTMSTVTSGEQIAVGDLLTSGTGGKAFVLDSDDGSNQRVAALALTAAAAADADVTCIVLAASVEERVPVTGSTTSAADSLAIPVTHAYVAKTTGADAEALTLANGVPGQILTITLAVDGGGTGTLTPATCAGFATVVFADAGDAATFLFVDATTGWILLGTAGVAAPPAISI